MMDYYLSVHHEFGPVTNHHPPSSDVHHNLPLQHHHHPALDRDAWSGVDVTSGPITHSSGQQGLSGHFSSTSSPSGHHLMSSSTSPGHQSPPPLTDSTTTVSTSCCTELPLTPLYVSATSGVDGGMSSAVFSPAAASSSYSYQPTYR